jgi:hypothetical protein
VLIYGSLPPAQVRLRPWFADRHLRALVNQETNRARASP